MNKEEFTDLVEEACDILEIEMVSSQEVTQLWNAYLAGAMPKTKVKHDIMCVIRELE